MLPIITFEPIQINLLRNQDLDQSSRSSSTMADNLLDRSSSTTTKMKTKPKTLTLYPITVEFNRLIRRRQQQQQQNRIDLKTISSSTAINNSSNNILNDVSDVDGLLYSTLIHYLATTATTTTTMSTHQNEMKITKEEIIMNLKQKLCMPGTRTLLLLANKQDVLDNHDDHDDHFNDGHHHHHSEDDQEMVDINDLKSSSPSSSLSLLSSTPSSTASMTIPIKIQSIMESIRNDLSIVSNKSINTKFITNFKHFLDQRFECQQKYQRQRTIINDDDDHDDNDDFDLKSMIGLEQQIYGALTFYKSYRLESLKIIEIELLAIKIGYERLGLGSQLIKFLKENNQIGPYDAMHVRITENNQRLRRFFLRNQFTDDLILNASFDQLIINQSDDSGDDNLDVDDDDDSTKSKSTNLQHSNSYCGVYSSSMTMRPGKKRKHEKNINIIDRSKLMSSMISMCYLPPFSIGTLSESIETANQRTTIERLDNHFVDDLIEQAQLQWRQNLLASYRTQWSLVGRLHSEIEHLRQQLTKRNIIIEQLRRENFNLRNQLVYRNRTTTTMANNNHYQQQQQQKNLQKQLLLYRTLQFDKLDF